MLAYTISTKQYATALEKLTDEELQEQIAILTMDAAAFSGSMANSPEFYLDEIISKLAEKSRGEAMNRLNLILLERNQRTLLEEQTKKEK